MRNVYCVCTAIGGDSIRGTEEDCERDDTRVKPIERRSCGEECTEFIWVEERWGPCSVDCGPGGEQTRVVYCQISTSMTRTTDRDCLQPDVARQIGQKPETRRVCNPTPRCRYRSGTWSNCSVTCGGGRRSRTLGCERISDDGSQVPVPLEACLNDSTITGGTPASSEVCGTQSCC